MNRTEAGELLLKVDEAAGGGGHRGKIARIRALSLPLPLPTPSGTGRIPQSYAVFWVTGN